MVDLGFGVLVPDEEIGFEFARSGGPGGQNVNKVNSKARLRWNVVATQALPAEVKERFLAAFGSQLTTGGELLIAGQSARDQERNRLDCLDRLRAMVASVWHRPRQRRATRPTYGSELRRQAEKRANSARKQSRRSPGAED